MKKILFISAFPPGNRTAGQNYSSQLLADISDSFKVDLIYWSYPTHSAVIPSSLTVIEEVHFSAVRKLLNAISAFLFFPLFTVRFSWTMLRKISRIASDYDILYFDFSQVFLYSLFIKHPCKVFMCHDVISQKYSRKSFSWIYLWFVRMSEKILLKTASLRMCFSDKDAEYIKKYFGLSAERVAFFISDSISAIDLSRIVIEDYFVLYGAWNRPENYEGLIWFCENVLPYCDIRCLVVGGGMTQKVRDRIVSEKVTFTGFVDDPYPYIAKAACLIAPLFQGAGVKVKVIESLALGTPVIGTEIATEGVPDVEYAGGGHALTVVDSRNGFISSVRSFRIPSSENKLEIQDTFRNGYVVNDFKSIISRI